METLVLIVALVGTAVFDWWLGLHGWSLKQNLEWIFGRRKE
jgi:hypothetical protein